MSWSPPLSWAQALLLAVAFATVLVAHAWLQERSLGRPHAAARVALRAAVAALLALVWMNPVTERSSGDAGSRRPLYLLLDTSRSMSARDGGSTTRLSDALAHIAGRKGLLDRLGHRDVQVLTFSDRTAEASRDTLARLSPDGAATDIEGALRSLSDAPPGSEVVLVSDGCDTVDGAPEEAARALRLGGVTVSTFTAGKRTTVRDVSILAGRLEAHSVPGETARLAFRVRAENVAGATVRLQLLRDGRHCQSRTLHRASGWTDVAFDVREPSTGLHLYSLRAQPLPGESDPTNNMAATILQTSELRARVLMLEAEPSWDARFLALALRRVRGVELDVVYRLTPARYFAVLSDATRRTGIQLPRSEDAFAHYDVVIAGHGIDAFYQPGEVRALRDWVAERGGALVLLRGRPEERTRELGDLEPVTWTDEQVHNVRVALTAEGQAYQGFSSPNSGHEAPPVWRMPSLTTVSRTAGEKALTVVLARGASETEASSSEMAVLAHRRYGQGIVLAVSGDGLWRWAFAPPPSPELDGVYDAFWARTLRWLLGAGDFLPGARSTIRPDRRRVKTGDEVRLRVDVRGGTRGAHQWLVVDGPNGERERVPLRRMSGPSASLSGVFRPHAPGPFVLSFGPANSLSAALVMATLASPESEASPPDHELMRHIADCGGGQALTADDLRSLARRWERSKHAERTRHSEPTWDRWWVLASACVLLFSEWTLRRRVGLA